MTERKIDPRQLREYLDEGIEFWTIGLQNKEAETREIEARISTLKFIREKFFPSETGGLGMNHSITPEG